MKFLIAGLGSIGRRHLRNLLTLGQKDILLYRTHKSTLPDEELVSFPVETELSAALAHHPDAVIVTNPTARHLDVAFSAAQEGCHLFIEKPIADRWSRVVKSLQHIVTEKQLKTLVGFQFRFHPTLMQIKDLLDSGSLGRVYSFRCHWGEYLPGWHPWEDYRQSYAAREDLGGGVVNTLCHPLDYIRWLFGEVTSLTAVTGRISELDLGVEDVAEIILTLKDGGVGSVHLDYFQRPPGHWIRINCEKGHIRWDNETGAARVYNAFNQSWKDLEPPPGFERNKLFLDEMRHFLALLVGEGAPRCSLMDGVNALRLTEAVHESQRSHQTVFFSEQKTMDE